MLLELLPLDSLDVFDFTMLTSSFSVLNEGLIGHNTFAYCGNSPISRIDTLGDSWVAVLGAVGVQYASDVFGNIVDGKIGWDIFIPTSSLATYTAVAVTSLIPGGNLVSAAVRSTVTEAIIWTDNILRGVTFSVHTLLPASCLHWRTDKR